MQSLVVPGRLQCRTYKRRRGQIGRRHELRDRTVPHDRPSEVIIDGGRRYAAGCVIPGQLSDDYRNGSGSGRGQAINRELCEEDLQRHTLPRREAEIHERKAQEQSHTALQYRL